MTNCVVHAYSDGRPPGTVTLSAELVGEELVCTVSDDGCGLRSRINSPGLGLGLPMIAAVTTSMTMTVAEAGGTQLCMAFARRPVVPTGLQGA